MKRYTLTKSQLQEETTTFKKSLDEMIQSRVQQILALALEAEVQEYRVIVNSCGSKSASFQQKIKVSASTIPGCQVFYQKILIDFELEKTDTKKYEIIMQKRSLSAIVRDIEKSKILTDIKKREFSTLTLVAEFVRYLNCPPLYIESILKNSKQGLDTLLFFVNNYNEIIYDV